MKLNKIFAIALAALTMSACSDDDPDFNTAGGVTVQMKQQTIEISEDLETGKYYSIPVVLSGETNGPVSVSIEVQGTSSEPATEGEHYLITSKTITIPAGELEGNYEFYPVGDEEINDDRQFIVTITSAQGATVGTQSTCIVTLKDNEGLIPNAYANMGGTWIFKANNEGETDIFPVECLLFPEGNPNYTKALVFTNWRGDTDAMIIANFSFDASTNKAIISFPMGQWIHKNLNFGAPLGICDVLLATVSGNNLVASGSISAEVSEDFQTMTFDPEAIFLGAIFSGTNFTGYTNFWWDTMSMER